MENKYTCRGLNHSKKAKEKPKADKFIQGYACALACIIQGHGCGTEVREAFGAGIGTIERARLSKVDHYDLEILKKHFK